AVRQLASRARGHVQARRPRFPSDPATQRQVTERFLAASTGGDLATLMGVLAPGVTLVADGGGKARAPRVPVRGAEAVAQFLLATARPDGIVAFLSSIGRAPGLEVRFELAQVNGEAAIVATAEGRVVTAIVLEVAEERVQVIW